MIRPVICNGKKTRPFWLFCCKRHRRPFEATSAQIRHSTFHEFETKRQKKSFITNLNFVNWKNNIGIKVISPTLTHLSRKPRKGDRAAAQRIRMPRTYRRGTGYWCGGPCRSRRHVRAQSLTKAATEGQVQGPFGERVSCERLGRCPIRIQLRYLGSDHASRESGIGALGMAEHIVWCRRCCRGLF